MDIVTVSLTLAVMLVIFMGGTLWIGMALFLVAMGSFLLFTELPFGTILANTAWNNTSGSAMMALPMFVWMGEILFRSHISQNLFKGLTPWMDRIPGRLLHVNVLACTFFAAVSGSSAATTATVGKITVPELESRGYNRALASGSLARRRRGLADRSPPPARAATVISRMMRVQILPRFSSWRPLRCWIFAHLLCPATRDPLVLI